MSGVYLPSNVKELFEKGEEHYYIYNGDPLDNIQSMNRFIDIVDGLYECVELNDGTQIVVAHREYPFKLQIDSGGLGDFCDHGYTVSVLVE